MFSHYNDPEGCEWHVGGLDAFVQHYNDAVGTGYSLTKCLDIAKIAGTTPKEPEVLVTDENTGQRMVIERKSVVWPRAFLLQHNLGHEFADLIWKGSNGRFCDASYELTVGIRDFNRLTRKQVRDIGKEISEEISRLSANDLPIWKTKPIEWSFRKMNPGEDEDCRKGITVLQTKTLTLEDFDNEEAKAEMPAEIQIQLDSAARKFEGYSNHIKLVLLDFYCERLWEDDVPPMMQTVSVPAAIDEVWRTIRNWVSENDYEIGYDQLFRR